MKNASLLFVYPVSSSFVLQDQEMLSRHFEIRSFQFGVRRGISMLTRQLYLLFWLFRYVWKADIVFVWFADYHSLLPCLISFFTRRKSFVVIGGYEAADLGEYNYGGNVSFLRRLVIDISCRLATRLFPVSRFVDNELFRNHLGLQTSQSVIIHNGIESGLFKGIKGPSDHRSGVICVSVAKDRNRLGIKGVDLLMQIASILPQVQFTIVGISHEAANELRSWRLINVKIAEFANRQDLEFFFENAKVICQFSRFESFGLALAEGMLCGCIPLIVAGTGTSEIVGDASDCVSPSNQIEDLLSWTIMALNRQDLAPLMLMSKISREFAMSNRETKILEAMGRPWD